MNIIKCSLISLVVFYSSTILSDESSSVKIRPHIGVGSISDLGSREFIYHAGGRLLLRANDFRRFGMEVTRFSLKSGKTFTSAGIILEQRLFGWFNMSIGTIGYFGYNGSSQNPVGLTTNLGWEPKKNNYASPFITYKNDFIFTESVISISSVSLGFSW